MASWDEILNQAAQSGDLDALRRKFLADLAKKTGRNVIAFYSGWLQKPGVRVIDFNINDE